MMSIGTFLGIASLLFTGFTSYENKRSNDISRHNSQQNEQLDRAKETVIAIREFSKHALPIIHLNHISVNKSMMLITYVNRWSVYVDEGIVDREMIKSFLGPYLEYISDTMGYTVIKLTEDKPKLVSGYVNLMDNFGMNPI